MLVPVVLGVLTLFYMTPFLFPPTGNEALNGHDLLDQQYPLLSFIFDSVRSGQGVPLWNPYQLSGESIIGNPQNLIFYPPAWLLLPLGVPRGVGWLVILHLWLGAWGMAAFVRRLGAGWAGALAGACVYAFSAVLSARLDAGHINYMICQAWLPWAAAAYLWSTERAEAWWRRGLFAAAALGMAALSGSTHLFHLGAVWLAALWLYATLLAPPGERLRAAWRAFRPLALAGAGAAVLGAVVLLPAGMMGLHSARVSQDSLAFSNSFPLGGSQLITLIFPNMLGEPHLPDHGYWGLPFYEENTFYVGLLPLVALFLARPRPAKTWLAACLVVALALSLGTQGGLFTVLYWFLPGYRLFRVPPRALYFVAVSAAGLMALWVTDLQGATSEERARSLRPALRWGLPGLGLLALLASFAFTFYYSIHSGDEAPPWRAFYSGNMIGIAVMFVVFAWLVVKLWSVAGETSRPGPTAVLAVTLGVILIDLWHISMPMVHVSAVDVPDLWQTLARVAPSTPEWRVMVIPDTIAWQNGATYTRHLSIGGYEQLVDARYQRLLDAAGHDPLSPASRLLGVRYAVSATPLPDEPTLTLLAKTPGLYFYEVRDTFPHAFVAPSVEVVADDQAALNAINTGPGDLLQTALLDHPAGCATSATAGVPARIIAYAPNAVTVAADSPSGGVLVLTDVYDAGWSVSVDGRPAPLLRVDVALRGVCVPPGAHRVVFTYKPPMLWAAGALSGAAWLALCLVAVAALARRFRAHRGSRQPALEESVPSKPGRA